MILTFEDSEEEILNHIISYVSTGVKVFQEVEYAKTNLSFDGWADKVLPIMRKMEVLKIDNTEAKVKGKMVPIWKKYMLTVDEAVLYFGIGEKKIRMLISENVDSDYCFTVQVGNKSLINRHKFEEFLNQTTSL